MLASLGAVLITFSVLEHITKFISLICQMDYKVAMISGTTISMFLYTATVLRKLSKMAFVPS